jgi:hypothetical protein
MSYDTWLEEPYQREAAAQERAAWVESCTCPRCGYIAPQPLDEDLCTECASTAAVCE